MKKILNGIMAIIMVAVFLNNVSAQEQIVPLSFNPVITKSKSVPPSSLRTLDTLPFLDDFSYQTIYPDPNKWVDRQAFVNTTFPLDPPSIGVASLDGLNQFGHPYDSISHSFYSIGSADTLTSQPLFLSSFSNADNVGLSFFYEAGGIGDDPNSATFNLTNFSVASGDSLILEFKDSSNVWQHIWAKDGADMQHFRVDSIIYIRNSSFFYDGFQFRFRNIASRIGLYDVWNIDYVKLDKNRLPGDTVITDIAIQYLPTSILRNYRAMPWNQFFDFQSTDKADVQHISVKSNFVSGGPKNMTREMSATEKVTNTFLYSEGPFSNNIDPQEVIDFTFDVQTFPDFPTDSVIIETKFIVTGQDDNNSSNDTISRLQHFSNYLAYDDGSPEVVYRLLGSPASLAMQFHLNTPDTLRAVEIMFAHTEINLTPNLFNLYVWRDTTDADTLLRDEFETPLFSDELNGFAFYRLSRPIPIEATFYIGWQQVSLQSDLKMDVGFDLNDTANQYLFYNIDGTWQQSAFPGALMIRPVIGKAIPQGVGIPGVDANNDFRIYPNPVNDFIFVEGGSNDLSLEVIDMAGKTMMRPIQNSKLEIGDLPTGMYLLRITDLRNGKTSIKKFIKAE